MRFAALADILGGEAVRTGFMARSRSLARFASRCSGASLGTKPNLPTGSLQLRTSGIRGRPSPHRAGPQGERAGTGEPARHTACRAAMPRIGPALELCGVNSAKSVMWQGFCSPTPHN